MKKILLAIGLMLSAPVWAASVFKNGQEWLQPSDFEGVARSEVNTACPAAAGRLCSGTLAGVDVTGFVFASIAEVNALMANYGVPAPDLCGGSAVRVPGSSWAPAAFADFAPTLVVPGAQFLEAMASDANICDAVTDVTCDFVQSGFIGIQSEAAQGDGYCTGPGGADGVWLYRTLPVSIATLGHPGLWVLGLGLLLLAGRRLAT